MHIDRKRSGLLAFALPLVAASVLAITTLAQTGDQTPIPSVATATAGTAKRTMPEVKQPLPFGSGEVMKFEVKFSRFPIYASVGEMTFTVSEEKVASEKPGKGSPEKIDTDKPVVEQPGKTENQQPIAEKTEQVDRIRIHAEAVSKGALVSLFGVKVKDQFDSFLDKKDLGTYTCKVSVDEGKRHREQITIIERDKHQITYTDRDLNEKTGEPRVVKSEFKDWPLVFDPVGALFFIRSQELKIGQSVTVPISDNGKPSEVEIVSIANEDLKVGGDSFKTVKLEAKVFDGALFNGKGEMFIWLSDDKYRMPVKFQVKAKYGTVTGNLISKTYSESAPPTVKTPDKSPSKRP